MQSFGKVVVLMGGSSSERNVSLDNGAVTAAALKGRGVNTRVLDLRETPSADSKTQGFQMAFNILYGTYGEDGVVQGTLELFGIPYIGSGVTASAIGMDKYRCKLIWRALGLPAPEFVVLREDTDFEAVGKWLGLPVSAKPASESSSVGVVKVKEKGRLKDVYAELKYMRGEIIVERFIGGGEYSCPMLGGCGLPLILIVPATESYDYEAKYDCDDAVYRYPSDLNAVDGELMCELAVRGAEAIGAEGCVRVDSLKDLDGKLYLLEVNTLSDTTNHSLVPESAAQIGMNFPDLCIEILRTAHVG